MILPAFSSALLLCLVVFIGSISAVPTTSKGIPAKGKSKDSKHKLPIASTSSSSDSILPAGVPITPLSKVLRYKLSKLSSNGSTGLFGTQGRNAIDLNNLDKLDYKDAIELLEVWGPSEDPRRLSSYLGVGLKYNVDSLPSEAGLPSPWPASYYPTYVDSINWRWASPNIASPTAKYAKAFNLPVDHLESAISRSVGIDSVSGRPCSHNGHCYGDEACGIRLGQSVGKCIQTWTGLCHAWAPAAYMEKEPECLVRYNGVRFDVEDIKALIITSYHYASFPILFMAERCSEYAPRLDQWGRPISRACRDMNAGAFHLLLTNYLGIHGKNFVMDRDRDYMVWNHPLRAYRILTNNPLSRSQAAAIFRSPDYPFNDAATQFRHIRLAVWYTGESEGTENVPIISSGRADEFTEVAKYDYVLELNDNGDILGGEWIGESVEEHPDFIWIPQVDSIARDTVAAPIRFRRPDGSTFVDGIRYSNVKWLLERSLDCTGTNGVSMSGNETVVSM